ncbi:hypothetical protein [Anaerotignum lactatifermentans]|uniref:hypothetical protein n=1 Tax=Anaerotignum lactatifermentans TaxID=160404 RepID=UPI00255CBD89|nr:hypothetical protein [Anaerotignum lactatifermentans]
MMVLKDLIKALKRMKVETGSLVCLGCGYEHNCGLHGCRILRETVSMLEDAADSEAPEKMLNPAGEYAVTFARNHGMSIQEAMEQPMVKARFEVFNKTGW